MDWLARPRGVLALHWGQRDRLLRTNPQWRERDSLAHDLRNGAPFSDVPMDIALDAKRRYQWARESWLAGYLSASDFLREAGRFDRAVRVFRLHRYHELRPLLTIEQMARERVRLRKQAASEVVDLNAWRRLASAMTEYREREQAWQQARVEQAETARQRKALREGHQTLLTIKRMLRGAVPLPQPESRLARTSPT